jgi:uncharacterized damage-inducible protein DinB
MRKVLQAIEVEYRRYKQLAEGAFTQAKDAELADVPAADGNSIATIVWHMSGNLRSRFTDFLTTDGEKPWRDRESEFEERSVTRAQMLGKWEEGWSILFAALAPLDDSVLDRQVTIRDQKMTVLEALLRSVTHASHHVGQIVLLVKNYRGKSWKSLSIPKGGLPR